ncbi:MAG TPA: hypothetical protein VG943_16465 [Caulobacterales bacterium]|nr:hypothetical protein [Caulobacterales bacterium]
MRGAVVLTVVAIGLAACASPGQMRNLNRETDRHGYRSYSWGKAGVSFEDYREAVFQCTSAGVLSPTEARPQFDVDTAGSIDQMIQSAAQVEAAQQRDQMRQRHQIIDNCLVAFGFRRFGLTDRQLARLDTLPRGSEERQHYLYALGSNPNVLRRQQLGS